MSKASVKEQSVNANFQAGKAIGENLAELFGQNRNVAGMIISLYDTAVASGSETSVSEQLADGMWHGYGYDEPRSITRHKTEDVTPVSTGVET